MTDQRELYKQAEEMIGKTVKLKGGNGKTAVVRYAYRRIPGGVRLDTRLDGFLDWNVGELEQVTE